MGLCLSRVQRAHSVPAEVSLTVVPGNLFMQVMQVDTCNAASVTAIKFVIPKSFNACAFPMYKLGNAWEMNTCVQACMPLGYKCFQAFPRGVQAWTQAFISQAFPSLYMGNAQALKLLGTTNFIAVRRMKLAHFGLDSWLVKEMLVRH